MYSVVCTYCS